MKIIRDSKCHSVFEYSGRYYINNGYSDFPGLPENKYVRWGEPCDKLGKPLHLGYNYVFYGNNKGNEAVIEDDTLDKPLLTNYHGFSHGKYYKCDNIYFVYANGPYHHVDYGNVLDILMVSRLGEPLDMKITTMPVKSLDKPIYIMGDPRWPMKAEKIYELTDTDREKEGKVFIIDGLYFKHWGFVDFTTNKGTHHFIKGRLCDKEGNLIEDPGYFLVIGPEAEMKEVKKEENNMNKTEALDIMNKEAEALELAVILAERRICNYLLSTTLSDEEIYEECVSEKLRIIGWKAEIDIINRKLKAQEDSDETADYNKDDARRRFIDNATRKEQNKVEDCTNCVNRLMERMTELIDIEEYDEGLLLTAKTAAKEIERYNKIISGLKHDLDIALTKATEEWERKCKMENQEESEVLDSGFDWKTLLQAMHSNTPIQEVVEEPVEEEPEEEDNTWHIKNIYIDEKAGTTVVIFADNTKYISKCQEGDVYDFGVGFALCLAKKATGDYSKFIRNLKKSEVFHDCTGQKKEKKNKKSE